MIEINNEALIKEVDMQSMLFQKVKKYAQEIGELEKQARTAAVQLQIYSNKAMALKAKMFKVYILLNYFFKSNLNIMLMIHKRLRIKQKLWL